MKDKVFEKILNTCLKINTLIFSATIFLFLYCIIAYLYKII